MSMRASLFTSLAITACILSIPAADARTIHVDADATGANDGTSWEDAYFYLQDALMFAVAGDEIRVAQGIYRPDRSAAEPNGTGDRMATFRLINGVAIKGGYAGFSEPDPNARDIELYETVLRGDLDENDIDVNNPADLLDEPTRAENSYHVVIGSGTDETGVLDGFTITAGNANVFEDVNDSGGGMYNAYGSPTLLNCTFSSNSASNDGLGGGGGMANHYSNPTITNCTFSDNGASCWSGAGGGGMYNVYSNPNLANCTFSGNTAADYCGGAMWNIWSNPMLTNCTFSDNFAGARGGGIHNDYGSFSPTLINCVFIGNSASEGGGIFNYADSSPTLIKCSFTGNSAGDNGGAMANCYGNSPTLTNCIFVGNSAEEHGGGMYNNHSNPALTNCTFVTNSAVNGNTIGCDSYRQEYPSNLQLGNCILWDGEEAIWNNDGSTISISYSDVQGGWGGLGNIDADPLFVDSGRWVDANDPNVIVEPNDPNAVWVNGDYHLKSQGGRWEPNEGGWTTDEATSLCINAGDPMSPIGDEPFPNGGIVNMGAYGGTAEASRSYFGEPPCEIIIAGDINGDCEVNFLDFQLMALHWCEEGD
ncbi:MAG: hypothetical protein JXN61_13300 [Sedimentisphaerales bacterium]|nr:hypothetical protein [Sedimentisphaerales bacterium]